MNKQLKQIQYNQDDDEIYLIDCYEAVNNLIPRLTFKDKLKAINMLREISYFIDLKERGIK